ncbi:hypothetical protein [Streptomyces sp. NPDC046870]|uniref:hypothetical protein n=1 Tax=Streptomyces sp. NPDC046870 TaxID=3155135 RepID=UPI0034538124
MQGYVSVSPQATKQDLSDRFTRGSGIPASNLRGTCIDTAWEEALATARATRSSDMQRAFHPVYAARQKYSLSHLDALLVLYRYHKEVRNAVMHGGGKANPITEQAWKHAATLTAADIGSRTSPLTSKVTDGQMVTSDLREAIQLSDVLLRLVRTTDAELCVTGIAEQEFVTGWTGGTAVPHDADTRWGRAVPAPPRPTGRPGCRSRPWPRTRRRRPRRR